MPIREQVRNVETSTKLAMTGMFICIFQEQLSKNRMIVDSDKKGLATCQVMR